MCILTLRDENHGRAAVLLCAEVVISAFLRSLRKKGTEDLGHLSALALRATCMLGAVLGNAFGALEFCTTLVTSIFVYWHESSPAETTV